MKNNSLMCSKPTQNRMRKGFLFLLFIAKVLSDGCQLDVSDPESPFIVNDDIEFPNYDVDQSFNFDESDKFYIVCHRGTQSSYLEENGARAYCLNNTKIHLIKANQDLDFTKIKCKPSPATNVKKSNQKCANDKGTLYELGFEVFKDFLTMSTVCFDDVKLTPIYIKYNNDYSADSYRLFLQAQSIDPNYYEKFVCDGTDCGWSDSAKAFSTVIVSDIYDNQADILKNLGINVDEQLAKFPLATTLWYLNVANNGQQIEKAPFYDYLNVVPAWQTEGFNNLFYVLDIAIGNDGFYMGDTMFSGTLGVATLATDGGGDVEVYLSNDKMPVPKWIWVLWDKTEQVFFYYNHPNEADDEIDEVCSQSNKVFPSMFTCSYETVIDPEMKSLIDSHFT